MRLNPFQQSHFGCCWVWKIPRDTIYKPDADDADDDDDDDDDDAYSTYYIVCGSKT